MVSGLVLLQFNSVSHASESIFDTPTSNPSVGSGLSLSDQKELEKILEKTGGGLVKSIYCTSNCCHNIPLNPQKGYIIYFKAERDNIPLHSMNIHENFNPSTAWWKGNNNLFSPPIFTCTGTRENYSDWAYKLKETLICTNLSSFIINAHAALGWIQIYIYQI